MAGRFLIEVAHEPTPIECLHTIEVFLSSGSHYITHADWGCKDGEHKSWIIVEVDSKDDARALVPPAYRAHAKIIQLNAFSLGEVQELLRQHGS